MLFVKRLKNNGEGATAKASVVRGGENTILTISTGNFVFLLAEAFSFGLALANAIWTHTRYADKPELREISSAPTFANCVCVLAAAVLLSDILDVLQVFQ